LATNKNTSKTSKTSVSRDPQTMEEILAMYGSSVRGLSQGDKVKGKVIGKQAKRLVLDIGAKGEGIIAEKAYSEAQGFIKSLKIGDEIEATVIVPETPDGYTILSLRETAENETWKRLEEAKKKGGHIVVEGISVNPSGINVEIGGLPGFIPNSQLGKEVAKNSQSLIGRPFKVAVIDVDRSASKIVLSEKAVSEAEDIKLINDALESLKHGEIFDGEVTTLYDFGAFVRINVPLDGKKVPLEGLVHISEFSWDKVDHPRNLVSEGEQLKVKVIGKKDGKLALSIKQIAEDPWQKAEEKYPKDMKLKGNVARISDYGAFVTLEPGIEGLIHMTKIPPGRKLKEGDEVNVYVEETDANARKISLGLVLTEKPATYR
jgi:small subunit ribosomal protein S1